MENLFDTALSNPIYLAILAIIFILLLYAIIKKIIKSGEKKISNHIEEIILLFDSSNIFTIDISLKKKTETKKQNCINF